MKFPGIFKNLNAIVNRTAASRTALKQKSILDGRENFQANAEFFLKKRWIAIFFHLL